MPNPNLDAEIKIGDDVYQIRFTNAGIAAAERLTGHTVDKLAMLVGEGRFGHDMLGRLLCAGLEGARRKHKLRSRQWGLEEVEDLLDDMDDRNSVAVAIVEAFDAAMQKFYPDIYGEAAQVGDDVDPPTAAGTGKTSSEPPSVPA